MKKRTICKTCGIEMYKHGKRKVKVGAVQGNKAFKMILHCPRLKCGECGSVVTDYLIAISKEFKFTPAFAKWVFNKAGDGKTVKIPGISTGMITKALAWERMRLDSN